MKTLIGNSMGKKPTKILYIVRTPSEYADGQFWYNVFEDEALAQ